MKAVVFTLGCKVNEVESASIMSSLEEMGIETDDKLGFADLFVLNTCAVTREAERKSGQLVARVKKFNPNAPVYVCGCASEKDCARFIARGVKFVCGAKNKKEIVEEIARDFGLTAPCELKYPKKVKTRAFIKIEDGCNNFCSYCVIPYLRGRVRSRSVEEVLREVNMTDADEIVLTGINLSAYGNGEENLTSLIKALPRGKRVRLGSLECNVIDDNLLTALKEHADFAPQFHLSLQSGSDEVLKKMNRHYTRAEFIAKCNLIYSYFPEAAITTDIIAGFCGETEEDFKDSLSIIGEARLARVHAFAFSPREGTAAFKMKDVPPDIKNERLQRLLAAAKLAEDNFILSRKGRVREVIYEEYDGEYSCGYTEDYIKIYSEGELSGKRRTVVGEKFRDGASGVPEEKVLNGEN